MIIPARELMPVIDAALKRNQRVRLTVTGSSMFPFIRSGDVVELEPLHRPPAVGEVVLARCPSGPEGERYVVHRVVRVQGEALFLRGDSQPDSEGPFRASDLLALVTTLHRKGRAHRIDRGLRRRLGWAWNRSAPLNVWVFRLFLRLRGRRP